jgi:hypothetical protein
MSKYLTLLLPLGINAAYSQNIYTALHLNDEREYKTARPKKINEIDIFYNSNGKETVTSNKVFDNAGMLVLQQDFDEEGKLTKSLAFKNDTNKRIILERTLERWTNTITISDTAYYNYDVNNHLTGIEEKNAKGQTFSTCKIINDEKGNPIELTLFDNYGNFIGKEIASYNYEQNKVVTHVVSNSGENISSDTLKITYKKIISSVPGQDNYNDKGDIISYSSKNLNGTKTLFHEIYQYDSFGNCTDQEIYIVTTKSNGKQKLKLDRTFKKQYLY